MRLVFYLGEDSILGRTGGDYEAMLFFWNCFDTISDLVRLLFECLIVPSLSYWAGEDCSDMMLLLIPILGNESSLYSISWNYCGISLLNQNALGISHCCHYFMVNTLRILQLLQMVMWSRERYTWLLNASMNEYVLKARNSHVPLSRLSKGYRTEKNFTSFFPCAVVKLILRFIPLISVMPNSMDQGLPIGM